MSSKTWVFAGPIAAMVGIFLPSGMAQAETPLAAPSCVGLAQSNIQQYGAPACQQNFQQPVTQPSLFIGGTASVISPAGPIAASHATPIYGAQMAGGYQRPQAQGYYQPAQAPAASAPAQRTIQPAFGGTIIAMSEPYTLDAYGHEQTVSPASQVGYSISPERPTQSQYLGTTHAVAPQVPVSATSVQNPDVQIGGTQMSYYNAQPAPSAGTTSYQQTPSYQQTQSQGVYQPLVQQDVYAPQQSVPTQQTQTTQHVQYVAASPQYGAVSSSYQSAPVYQPSQQYQAGSGQGHYQTTAQSHQVHQQPVVQPSYETYAATQQVQPALQQQVSAGGGIYVQVGAFSLEGNTRRVMEDLIAKGFHSTSVRPVDVNGRYLHRVRVGPFADMYAAQAALQSVQAIGYPEAKIF